LNLYDLPLSPFPEELEDTLFQGQGVRVTRILSCGQSSPPGFWYDQPEDEWLVLLQGEARLAYPDGTETVLRAGDTLLLPAGKRHRVAETSREPVCLWLCVFAGPN